MQITIRSRLITHTRDRRVKTRVSVSFFFFFLFEIGSLTGRDARGNRDVSEKSKKKKRTTRFISVVNHDALLIHGLWNCWPAYRAWIDRDFIARILSVVDIRPWSASLIVSANILMEDLELCRERDSIDSVTPPCDHEIWHPLRSHLRHLIVNRSVSTSQTLPLDMYIFRVFARKIAGLCTGRERESRFCFTAATRELTRLHSSASSS